tara:strand:+ start:1308 stop:1619 length:312 start_codon:yes stop_codon:yes gene_type:complete
MLNPWSKRKVRNRTYIRSNPLYEWIRYDYSKNEIAFITEEFYRKSEDSSNPGRTYYSFVIIKNDPQNRLSYFRKNFDTLNEAVFWTDMELIKYNYKPLKPFEI